jgi:hypothetical protein
MPLMITPMLMLIAAIMAYIVIMLWFSPSIFTCNDPAKPTKRVMLQFIASSFVLFLIFTGAFSILLSVSMTLAISPLAVLLATIACYVFSILWYSPILFGVCLSCNPNGERSTATQFIGAFILSLLFSWVFAILLAWLPRPSFISAFFLAVTLWIGFSVSKHLRSALWKCDDKANSWIHIGADFGKFIIVAMILAAFIKKAALYGS